MESIVLELQNEALDSSKRVTDLLRKALAISIKLDLKDIQEWINKELNGYNKDDIIPDYRLIVGQVRGFNPYHGWMPVIFQDPEIGEKISSRKTIQPISEIENLIDNREDDSGLYMPFPQKLQRKLSKGFGFETEIALFADKTSLVKIVDSVRNIILNWTLKLEKDGILGKGLSFSKEEKETANKTAQNINYFFGTVDSPMIQQGTIESQQTIINKDIDLNNLRSFIRLIKNNLNDIDLEPDTKQEAIADITTLESQASSPNPKKNIIKESLSSLKKIFEGASGAIAAKILIELSKLLSG